MYEHTQENEHHIVMAYWYGLTHVRINENGMACNVTLGVLFPEYVFKKTLYFIACLKNANFGLEFGLLN